MKHVVFFAAPVGFFEKCSLTMKDNGKLFMSQEDYYKILDIKIDNKRNRTLYDFLTSRNLSLDDHRVCIVFVVLKLHIVSCWWLRGNDFSWAVLKKAIGIIVYTNILLQCNIACRNSGKKFQNYLYSVKNDLILHFFYASTCMTTYGWRKCNIHEIISVFAIILYVQYDTYLFPSPTIYNHFFIAAICHLE